VIRSASIGKGMTKGVTAPVVAVGAASAKAFTEVDDAMDTVVQKDRSIRQVSRFHEKERGEHSNEHPHDLSGLQADCSR